jgi:hypothetical protein
MRLLKTEKPSAQTPTRHNICVRACVYIVQDRNVLRVIMSAQELVAGCVHYAGRWFCRQKSLCHQLSSFS